MTGLVLKLQSRQLADKKWITVAEVLVSFTEVPINKTYTSAKHASKHVLQTLKCEWIPQQIVKANTKKCSKKPELTYENADPWRRNKDWKWWGLGTEDESYLWNSGLWFSCQQWIASLGRGPDLILRGKSCPEKRSIFNFQHQNCRKNCITFSIQGRRDDRRVFPGLFFKAYLEAVLEVMVLVTGNGATCAFPNTASLRLEREQIEAGLHSQLNANKAQLTRAPSRSHNRQLLLFRVCRSAKSSARKLLEIHPQFEQQR